MMSSLPKRSGEIWKLPPRKRSQLVRRVCEKLFIEYGTQRLGNPKVPLDDLIYIIISNRTTSKKTQSTYQLLKKQYKSWDLIIEEPYKKLYPIIKPAGLAEKKSKQIWSLINKIKNDLGSIDLLVLKHHDDKYIEKYLTSLPGVSIKVAKCVLMYTMDREVLPVDTHVYRISCRLGWVNRKRADQCHGELEALIKPNRRYAFHVDCILHGRKICKQKYPKCGACIIQQYCEYKKNHG
jgi:endonuclease III